MPTNHQKASPQCSTLLPSQKRCSRTAGESGHCWQHAHHPHHPHHPDAPELPHLAWELPSKSKFKPNSNSKSKRKSKPKSKSKSKRKSKPKSKSKRKSKSKPNHALSPASSKKFAFVNKLLSLSTMHHDDNDAFEPAKKIPLPSGFDVSPLGYDDDSDELDRISELTEVVIQREDEPTRDYHGIYGHGTYSAGNEDNF